MAGSEVVKMVLVMVTRSSALSSAAWASASGDTAGCWVACSMAVLAVLRKASTLSWSRLGVGVGLGLGLGFGLG